MFGPEDSSEKAIFIENEFKKRQSRRRGRPPSSYADGTDASDNVYATMLNDPEFQNILVGLLAAKGLDAGAAETSAFVELLKKNPELLRRFLPSASEFEGSQDQTPSEASEFFDHTPQQSVEMGYLSSPQLPQPEPVSVEHQTHDLVPAESGSSSQSVPAVAPIPRLGAKTEETGSASTTPPIPASGPSKISPPAYMPKTISRLQSPPSQDRVRALGFPPLVGSQQR